jgi:hypothetical protein
MSDDRLVAVGAAVGSGLSLLAIVVLEGAGVGGDSNPNTCCHLLR